jgi:hypothetical protein
MPRKPRPEPEQAAPVGTTTAGKVVVYTVPTGRPTLYKPEYAEIARGLCEAGHTDAQIAEHFGISERTLYYWRVKHPAFLQALKSGKEPADDRVERALYQRASGYTYMAVKPFMHQGKIVYAEYPVHVPVDPASAFFWLKNRRKADWRDKQDFSINVGDETEEQSALDTALDAILAIRRMKAEKDLT